MPTETMLQIQGYQGEPVPNRLRRPHDAKDYLAVLLPGFGYTLDMPLFYYAENLLLDQGWDVLRVEYAYNKRPEFQRHPAYSSLPEPERVRWLVEDVTAAYLAGRDQRDYTRIALIGKSLGTLAMGHLLTMDDQPPPGASAVWLTPLLGIEALRRQIRAYRGASLFVIGTADHYYEQETLDALVSEAAAEAVVVEGADHGMDVAGDPIASVRAVERVVEAMARFLKAH